MIEPVSRISGTQILRPRARILRTFGDELSSSETVAVIELVKNAYDADATRVAIKARLAEKFGFDHATVETCAEGTPAHSEARELPCAAVAHK